MKKTKPFAKVNCKRFTNTDCLNLKGCVLVYVPHVSGHKISVKGALGVGGGGEEGLKTYTSLRTRDGMVL